MPAKCCGPAEYQQDLQHLSAACQKLHQEEPAGLNSDHAAAASLMQADQCADPPAASWVRAEWWQGQVGKAEMEREVGPHLHPRGPVPPALGQAVLC